jgi:hypothetical protein
MARSIDRRPAQLLLKPLAPSSLRWEVQRAPEQAAVA